MRVFVFEHLVGGGALGTPVTGAMAREGAAMLQAVMADFTAAGCRVLSLRDTRLDLPLDDAQVEAVDHRERMLARFDALARQADASLVIAPESGGALTAWARRLEQLGVRSLGSDSGAIELCGDKLALAGHFARARLPTPPTSLSPQSLTPPLIAKPRDGAGCEATRLIHDAGQAAGLAADEGCVFQPYVPGVAASVSAIVHGGAVQVLPPGEQVIEHGPRLRYRGGRLPLPDSLRPRAAALAERAVRAVPGLRGYVGVDLVLADRPEGDAVIEINPRVTMSYTGLRHICRPSLAAAILDPAVRLSWRDRPLRFDTGGEVVWEVGA